MAEEEADAEDRTQAASAKRVERAREQGDVALSRETVHFASLGAASLGLALLGPQFARDLTEVAQSVLAGAHGQEPGPVLAALTAAAAPVALGVAGLAGLGALAATLLQTSFLVRGAALAPDAARLNPLAAAKRLFGTHGLAELARALLKLAAVGLALWWAAADLDGVAGVIAADIGTLSDAISARTGRLLAAAAAAMAGLALLDLLWVRIAHARKLRMTREDMREELRESEGDPHFKARRLQLARARSRKRAMAEVATATVVITNPTHYAVALAYERGRDAAPRVVAKGADLLAARIRALAEQHGVPIVPNPPLARALYRLPEEAEIPTEHFKAVAEVIAFVYRLRQGLR